ncbi:MAG: manganese-dependent inorganic pyrophosphatase [Candidatus Pacebacteria bacterium]|nr:manganese-dependent inorganic pyrophosphatase [Candidatus Paceibacterota bacterium]
MPTTYIIGHCKPDTDSVVAAMALEYLYQQWPEFGYPHPQAVITDPLNPETQYLFNKVDLKPPAIITAAKISDDDQVVLVDHNEASQRLADLNEQQIVEIVDHHKVNLNLNQPIFMTFKPWGSSATIVYYLMKKYQVKPPKKLALLMLAAILSDTVGFKSATTVKQDKKFAQELAKIAQVKDLPALTLELFKAKSNLAKLTDQQLVKNDYKVFDFAKKTLIGQVETVEQGQILAKRKTGLLTAMQQVKEQEQVELLFLIVTDVLKVNSKLLILSQAEQTVAEQAFAGKTQNQILDIGAKMSRKKEIAPAIEKTLAQLK